MMVHIWTHTIGKWEYRLDLDTADGRYYVQETNRIEFEQTMKTFATDAEAMFWILNKLSQHYGE